MSKVDAMIRPATVEEAGDISQLLLPYAARSWVLPRSKADIRGHIGDFLVANVGDRVVGCVSLREYGRGLVEIRSLAVLGDCAGHGLGTKLVQRAVYLAVARGATRVFALTVRPNLFTRLGFVIVNKSLFPEKVWADCVRCRKRDNCDETAVLLRTAAGL